MQAAVNRLAETPSAVKHMIILSDGLAAGSYFVIVYGGQANLALHPETSGLIIPYSREFTDFTANLNLLERLAEMTGSRVIFPDQENIGEILFSKGSEGFQAYRDQLFFLAVIALGFFIAGITFRRLRLPKGYSIRIFSKPKPEIAEKHP